jgi:hypothetical protein
LSYYRNTLFVGLETAINLRKRNSSKIDVKRSRKFKEDKNEPKMHNLFSLVAELVVFRYIVCLNNQRINQLENVGMSNEDDTIRLAENRRFHTNYFLT